MPRRDLWYNTVTMKKPSFKSASFGTTKYGEKAKIYTLRGAGGVVMEVSDYGGKIVRLEFRAVDRADAGKALKCVVLGKEQEVLVR